MQTPALLLTLAVLTSSSLSVQLAWTFENPPSTEQSGSSAPRTAVLSVKGVSCAGCSVRIRRVLKKMDGVEDVRSGNSKKRLEVDFDAAQIKPKQIAEAVKAAGFECWVVAVRKR